MQPAWGRVPSAFLMFLWCDRGVQHLSMLLNYKAKPFNTPAHLQLGIQICVWGDHMLVLLLPGDLDESLLGFPVFLLELVYHRWVLALDEAIKIVSGVTTAMTQRMAQCCDCSLSWKELYKIFGELIDLCEIMSTKIYLQVSSLHFLRLPEG